MGRKEEITFLSANKTTNVHKVYRMFQMDAKTNWYKCTNNSFKIEKY